ncbi:MAG TPA: 3-hydroxyacyl-CoA dehydrogenase NAD-binding domain-containing protein [Pseudomonadota bacterium]|nr:3-hydroxyacyl-CoA dehydrogenase NAD-binding domain-containing protein [Pseudomonadota bacterium]
MNSRGQKGRRFRRVAVLGAGVMGSGIAAHMAGAGLDVLLLDIVPPDAAMAQNANKKARNRFAQAGVDRLKTSKPSLIFHVRDLERISIGNLEDDLAQVGQADLVIEAVREDLAVKQALFAKLEPLLGAHTVLASNTSGLPIEKMMAGRSLELRRRFLVTHFFNPVRYMRLLELVSGVDTDPEVMCELAGFGETTLGKGIVYGKDTTNFVANRIGIFGMMGLISEALAQGFTVEEVDAIFGPPLGRPKSAVFRTADMVGLDTVIDVAKNCFDNLVHDEARATFAVPELLIEMVRRGYKGDKTGKGFYQKTKEGILSLDLSTLEYRPQQKPRFESLSAAKNLTDAGDRIRQVLSGKDRAATLAWKASAMLFAYSSRRIGPRDAHDGDASIADDLCQVDRAMRWGYGWELGPFEMWDAVGVQKSLARMEQDGIRPAQWVYDMLSRGRTSFYSGDPGQKQFFDLRTRNEAPVPKSARELSLAGQVSSGLVLDKNDGARLIDLGDDVYALEFQTKMNSIDADVIGLLNKAIDLCDARKKALVITNEAVDAFSAGANLMLIVMAAAQGNFQMLDKVVADFQNANQLLRYGPVPVVVAPFALTLGGGAEVTMHADAVRAHAELYMGLVEVGVGLIPGGGGCKELLCRLLAHLPDNADPFPSVQRTFETIGLAKVATSAEEARALGFLRETDGVTFNRDHLTYDAKQLALGLLRAGYRPPRQRLVRLPGPSGYANIRSSLLMMLQAHQILPHDLTVGSALAKVLTGGNTTPNVRMTEQQLLDLEREQFLHLCGEEKTRERMMYMLQNNKPLRN